MAKTTARKEPFWLGGAAACMAVCFNEIVVKTSTSMLATLRKSAARDGIPSLWAGLSASFLRQGTYSTARFGLHSYLSSQVARRTGQEKPSVGWNIACAAVSGGVAGLIGNPTEVVLVRMCADGAKPPADRFRYSNALQGMRCVLVQEGTQAFSRGLLPNVTRSVLMNVSQIASYAAAKDYLLHSAKMPDNIVTHIVASLAAGTVATTVCAPADVLKSRMQSSTGTEGLVQIIRKGIRDEGARFLMKGWTPAWLRLTPHTVLTFVFLEQLKRLAQLNFRDINASRAKM